MLTCLDMQIFPHSADITMSALCGMQLCCTQHDQSFGSRLKT